MLKTLITIVVFVVFLFSGCGTEIKLCDKKILNLYTFQILKRQVV